MSAKAQEALISSIFGRWNITNNPAAGTTAVGSVAGAAKTRRVLECLTASCRNQTASDYTAVQSVRDVSIAGTVLGQWEMLVAGADYAVVNLTPKIPGLVGDAVFVEFGTPAASVTQKVQASGYSEQES